MDPGYLGEYAGRGALLEITDVDLSKFDQAVADSGKVDGKQYAVTSGVNAHVVLANPALLAQSGITLPDDKTWTWDEYISTTAEITNATPDGVYGSASTASKYSPMAERSGSMKVTSRAVMSCRRRCGIREPFRQLR